MSPKLLTAGLANEKPPKREIFYCCSAIEEEHDRVSSGRVGEYASLASYPDVGFRPALLPINPFV